MCDTAVKRRNASSASGEQVVTGDQLRQPRKKPFASHHFEQPDFVNALPIVFQVLIDLRTTSLYRLAFAID
ncbi:hypothetical protein CTRI78_v002291 [Colletotrichum trifolii]|uniref:Uncharacterized protein n=1 Tax=Colletotrichum trifolii TaxID=5466 RepID=A0A4R8RMC4_COLTR|nr:hypothetical protein CTRI78_v002291 [Colletotrichum trifolii]